MVRDGRVKKFSDWFLCLVNGRGSWLCFGGWMWCFNEFLIIIVRVCFSRVGMYQGFEMRDKKFETFQSEVLKGRVSN